MVTSSLRNQNLVVDAQGDNLLNRALQTEAEQSALVDTATVENRYADALDAQLLAKQEQVDRIEDQLETLIGSQALELQKLQARRPGWLSKPGARAQWAQMMQRQEARLQRLRSRLDGVQEIREGMERHSSKLEVLAHRKVQFNNPALAREWIQLQVEQRRQRAQERGQPADGNRMERGKRLSLTLSRSD